MDHSGRDERGFGWNLHGDGVMAVFRTQYEIPLSVAWSCSPCRFGKIVEFDDPALRFIESATITSADSAPGGSVFRLLLRH